MAPKSPDQHSNPPGLPSHLKKRRKQHYRLRRRRYALDSLLSGTAEAEPGANEPSATAQSAHPSAPDQPDHEREAAQLRRKLQLAESITTQARGDAARKEAQIRELENALEEKKRQITEKDTTIDEFRGSMEQARNQLQRFRQEMEQQRRRTQKEIEDAKKYAGEELLRKLFPFFDHFTIAVNSINQGGDTENLIRGIAMVHREMIDLLSQEGFREINETGVPFDPNIHDAAATENRADQPDRVVLNVLREGYQLKDRVLRPAMVTVNKTEGNTPKPSEAKEKEQDSETQSPGAGLDSELDSDLDSPEAWEKSQKKGGPGKDPIDRARKMLETKFDEDE